MKAVLALIWFPVTLFAEESIDFEKQIRPLLQQHCVQCHGAQKQKGSLRLDAKSFAFKGGENGIVLHPHQSAKSELYRRISKPLDASDRMPPGKTPLSKTEIGILKRWIDAGASWPETEQDRKASRDIRLDHWAWQPIKLVKVPSLQEMSKINEIDEFIFDKLRQKNLNFSPEADRKTLIRRLSFDLIGLPPSPGEVQTFIEDSSADAYEKLLDRLLASPHYGERWARHWLDIAHYADTHGFERDQRRDHAWRYRDWVINAFNRDQPYNEFIRDQIAGDAISSDPVQGVVATGFLAAGPWDFVGQAETPSLVLKRLARADDLDDMITQVLTSTCAITINCARCHDHKLDPISQKEYYQLWAVFSGVKRGNRPLNAMKEKEYLDRRAQIEKKINELKSKPETKDQTQQLQKQLSSLIEPDRVYGIVTEKPPEIKVLHRGNPEDPKEIATPGSVSCLTNLSPNLGSQNSSDTERRIGFSRWVTDPKNPLISRVIVNRLWHHHFGMGIVDTPSDFGLGGGTPSHPELLDWLSSQLIKNQWSLKSIHRLICLSKTYRQQSTTRTGEKVDAINRLLWRQNPRRVDAESLRDAILRISGKLNPMMGGPGYRDFDYKEEYAPVYTYVTADRVDLLRRSIYRFIVRTTPQQFLTTLDCPNPANLSPTRTITTTALQSLALLNDDFMLKQSDYFAQRIVAEVGQDHDHQQIQLAFKLAFGRNPNADEFETAGKLLAKHGLMQVTRFLFNSNEFISLD
jgi:predicted DNA-binding protein YlxM (UPF0122 family)